MSVQFGRWNLDGRPIDSAYLERVGAAVAPYGPDGRSAYSDTNISILYYAFHTTKESHLEAQPYIAASGAVITWDGRLDNRAELITELRDSLTINSTDVAIVAAAYERWGTSFFARFIGDWALSIWDSHDHSLLLAKDPVGTRHLYYTFDENQITWSTVIDPLVRFAGKSFELNEEYIAGWISMFPAVHLTPCVGVHSVPPSSYVLLGPGKHSVSKYWDFDPKNRIHYRSDAEYEEHFRSVFGTAVQRRLRSSSPVLAELSGGRDSSSIVCVADSIIACGEAECPRLDTLSYYDDDEPNWNERPYFTKVEEKRGRTGWHINVGGPDAKEGRGFQSHSDSRHCFVPCSGHDDRISVQIGMCIASQGNRVVLSGVGGDETMGGVPTPIPELEDLLAGARFGALAHHLKVWALEKRKPWFQLFWDTARRFFPPALIGVPQYVRLAPWLRPSFVEHNWQALAGYPSRTKLFGARPSFQESVGTLNALRRQLACKAMSFEPPFEKRYPFLDRDLLEFMFAIPREQLVRPSQRRSLMRRAFVGMVPDEILGRNRKAVVVRAPLIRISRDCASLVKMTQHLVSGSLGILDPEGLRAALQKARRGEESPVVLLMRAIFLEQWLRNLLTSGAITSTQS